jgi:uncharacterized protein YecT (DUF1311 family)
MLLSLFLFAQAASATPAAAACDNPSRDDARPYTLCLAEIDLEQEEMRLNRQLRITLARVRARFGIAAERRFRHEQREWARARNRKCEAMAAATPVTQNGRNEMACRSQLNAERIRHLKQIGRTR